MPTSDLPMVDVLQLRPLEGYRLWLRFTDGSEGVHELSQLRTRVSYRGAYCSPIAVLVLDHSNSELDCIRDLTSVGPYLLPARGGDEIYGAVALGDCVRARMGALILISFDDSKTFIL
jgi:hypothetical protein